MLCRWLVLNQGDLISPKNGDGDGDGLFGFLLVSLGIISINGRGPLVILQRDDCTFCEDSKEITVT